MNITQEQIIQLKDADLRIHELEELHGFTAEVESILYAVAEFCTAHNISPEDHKDLCAREQYMLRGLVSGRDCHFCKYDCCCNSWWKTQGRD